MIDASLASRIREATVRIVLNNGTTGTGFFIGARTIATCAHVVTPVSMRTEPVRIVFHDETSADAYLTLRRPEQAAQQMFPDVAVLVLSAGEGIPIGTSDDVCPGDAVYAWGFAGTSSGEALFGQYEGEKWFGPTPDEQFLKFHQAQVVPGMSGAPLVNARTRLVCGIVKRTRDKESELGGYAVPIRALAEYCGDERSGAAPVARSDSGAELRELYTRIVGLADRVAGGAGGGVKVTTQAQIEELKELYGVARDADPSAWHPVHQWFHSLLSYTSQPQLTADEAVEYGEAAVRVGRELVALNPHEQHFCIDLNVALASLARRSAPSKRAIELANEATMLFFAYRHSGDADGRLYVSTHALALCCRSIANVEPDPKAQRRLYRSAEVLARWILAHKYIGDVHGTLASIMTFRITHLHSTKYDDYTGAMDEYRKAIDRTPPLVFDNTVDLTARSLLRYARNTWPELKEDIASRFAAALTPRMPDFDRFDIPGPDQLIAFALSEYGPNEAFDGCGYRAQARLPLDDVVAIASGAASLGTVSVDTKHEWLHTILESLPADLLDRPNRLNSKTAELACALAHGIAEQQPGSVRYVSDDMACRLLSIVSRDRELWARGVEDLEARLTSAAARFTDDSHVTALIERSALAIAKLADHPEYERSLRYALLRSTIRLLAIVDDRLGGNLKTRLTVSVLEVRKAFTIPDVEDATAAATVAARALQRAYEIDPASAYDKRAAAVLKNLLLFVIRCYELAPARKEELVDTVYRYALPGRRATSSAETPEVAPPSADAPAATPDTNQDSLVGRLSKFASTFRLPNFRGPQ